MEDILVDLFTKSAKTKGKRKEHFKFCDQEHLGVFQTFIRKMTFIREMCNSCDFKIQNLEVVLLKWKFCNTYKKKPHKTAEWRWHNEKHKIKTFFMLLIIFNPHWLTSMASFHWMICNSSWVNVPARVHAWVGKCSVFLWLVSRSNEWVIKWWSLSRVKLITKYCIMMTSLTKLGKRPMYLIAKNKMLKR